MKLFLASGNAHKAGEFSAFAKATADRPEKLQAPITKAVLPDGQRAAGESIKIQAPRSGEEPKAATIDPPTSDFGATRDEEDEEEEPAEPVELSEIELENVKWRKEHGF